MKILNMTQHKATGEQLQDGVVEPDGSSRDEIINLITFTSMPNGHTVKERAVALAKIAKATGVTHAMIGGAPYLQGPLEKALRDTGIIPVYSFSMRDSVEETLPDGSVVKRQVFRHQGWVEGCC